MSHHQALACCFVDYVQNPYHWQHYSTAQPIIDCLRSVEIRLVEPMQKYLDGKGFAADFTSDVQVITLENGIKAVFKPVEDDDLSSYGEVAAYNASCYLGFPFVPPTVLREVNGRIGSLQLLVETMIDLERCGTSLDDLFDPEEFKLLKIFYYLMGQWDARKENLLLKHHGGKDLPIAIDNANIIQPQYSIIGQETYIQRTPKRHFLALTEHPKAFPFRHAEKVCINEDTLCDLIVRHTSDDDLEIKRGFAARVVQRWQARGLTTETLIVFDGAIWLQSGDKDQMRDPGELTSDQRLQILYLNEQVLKDNIFNIETPRGNLRDLLDPVVFEQFLCRQAELLQASPHDHCQGAY